jgi:hypothetical protein
MKNKIDENIEKLVDKMMAESPVESPSLNFTASVMSTIAATAAGKSPVYKPVISKRGWFIILGAIAALFAFLIFNSQTTAVNYYFNYRAINFDKILKPFTGIQISPLTSTVLLAATVMLLIQIFFLKSILHKRFEK